MIELNGIQLDKTSAVPLYEQLRKALLEAITSGKLSAGTKLPKALWNACGAAVLLCAAPIPAAAS